LFSSTTTYYKPTHVILPDGSIKSVTKVGQIPLQSNLVLQNVLYVPEFKFNLLSIGKLLSDQPIFTTIYYHKCVFQDLITEKVVAIARFDGGLYRLSFLSPGPPVMQSSKLALTASNNAQCDSVSFNTLHARLGHTSMSKMQHIALCKSHKPMIFSMKLAFLQSLIDYLSIQAPFLPLHHFN